MTPMTPALATTMSSRPSSAVPWLTAASTGEVTDVGLHRHNPAAVLAHQGRGLLEVRERGALVRDGLHRRADVDRDDVRTLLGEPDRLGASLTASGAGDQGHLAVYQAHCILLRYVICRSDVQPGEQALVVDRRTAEQQLGRLGPAEVQVGWMLPGEADAAVHLDVLGRGEHVGLGTADVRRGGGDGELGRPLVSQPGRLPDRRFGELDPGQHVRALVLDRLEGADRPAELEPGPGVLRAHLQAPPGTPRLL